MITFEHNTGPLVHPPVSYPFFPAPDWWTRKGLGLFIHWGLYSIPAWAELPGQSQVTDTRSAYAHHLYAEWIENTIRIPHSPARTWWEHHYPGVAYEDLAPLFTASGFDAEGLADLSARIGAGYVILTAKHHDGFCLWDTATTDFHSFRDLVGETAAAVRARGLRFGVYFSGALDWHQSAFPPLVSNAALFSFRRQDPQFAVFNSMQLRELIDRYHPDVLWNDIDWPDAGKGHEDWSLGAVLRHYKDVVPDGFINDRWGIPCHGHVTREYCDQGETGSTPWEITRGLGHSFGYNRQETAESILTAGQLSSLLFQTRSAGGNLLINIGLAGDGHIPRMYEQVLTKFGGMSSCQ